jgi:hypothetical protein
MARPDLRRLADVDADHTLLGLLCLKSSRAGYCSDAGIQARAAERRHRPVQSGQGGRRRDFSREKVTGSIPRYDAK